MCLIGSTSVDDLAGLRPDPHVQYTKLVVLRLRLQVRIHEGQLVLLLRKLHEGLQPVLLLLRSSPKSSLKIQSLVAGKTLVSMGEVYHNPILLLRFEYVQQVTGTQYAYADGKE